MHGVILYHLRQFAVERFGPDCWDNAQAAAGLEDQVYVPVRLYPDGDMDALVAALEDETALHRNDLLEAFGKWVIPPLINMYRALIPRHWNARDFLLNVEEQVHQKVVRLKDPEARPPRIEARELAPSFIFNEGEAFGWEPESGHADPSGTAMAYSVRAREMGASVVLESPALGVEVRDGRVRAGTNLETVE